MRFQLVSDLHLERDENYAQYQSIITPSCSALLLAGDICSYGSLERLREFLDYYSPLFEEMYHVAGNHEYYTNQGDNTPMRVIDHTLKTLEDEYSNYTYIKNKCIIFDDVLLIGTTLWSFIPAEHFNTIHQGMRDYSHINRLWRGNTRPLLVSDTQDFHHDSLMLIQKCLHLYPNYKKLLLTHHKPLWENKRGQAFTHAFETDMSYFTNQFDLCLYGHTHEGQDIVVNETRFVSNPYGYSHEETGYRSDMVVEL